MNNIKPGAKGEATVIVTEAMTARSVGSGDVNAYATPAMVALMEQAAIKAIAHLLSIGQTSVGTSLEISHLAPTPPGQKVKATAEVFNIDGREIIFTVKAWNEKEQIGEGMHSRIVVDAARFSQRLMGK